MKYPPVFSASLAIYNIVVLFRFGSSSIISKCQNFESLQISVKSGKKYISIQGGVKIRKPSILVVPKFHPVFHFSLSAPTAAT
jgi:hypothetical protein